MSNCVNVGARVDGGRPASKAALRRALTSAPDTVVFDNTAMFVSLDAADYTPATLPDGVSLSVVGPDPYSNRKWYATVTRTAKGVRLT